MADEQRTERATPRRRKKALERGQLARTRELSSSLALLGVALLLRWGITGWLPVWRDLFRHVLAASARPDMGMAMPLIGWTATSAARWAGPPLALAWCVSLVGLLLQGGFVFTPLAFQPNFSRLNPFSNISRIFSVGALGPTMKSLVPAAFLIYFAVSIITRDWIQLIHSSQIGLHAAVTWLFNVLYEFSWKGGLVLLIWSGADYGLQRWNYERSLRMTKQEIRDEYKELEGNPATRGRIRRKLREMRRRQMLNQVKRATVVVANPDHFAIALEYVPEKMAAPLVLAKGRGEIARQIKREARWHDVPIVENPPLAQALYRAVEVGSAIPAKLYAAVAEVLAFIYRAQARMKAEQDARRAGTRPR